MSTTLSTAERLARARHLAESVPDPELPPLTIGELGIVRGLSLADDGELVVTVTPTYSGCPAVEYIEARIVEVLEAEGLGPVTVTRTFTPAWSTEWMSESGRRKLADDGIAPPHQSTDGPVPVTLGTKPSTPPCPRCGSNDTELISRFGSTACKALCRCLSCHEPFDHFKPI